MAKAKKKESTLTLEEKLAQALVPESEQPYKVPKNWCWTYAPSIFTIEYGKGISSKQLTKKGYPVFGANGIIGCFSDYMYETPVALMSCRGAYSGKMNLSLPHSYITSNSLIIRDKLGEFEPKFICYLFTAISTEKLISGSAQPQVTVQAFSEYEIPLPPLAEQQRIVDRIESLFSKLDEAKEKLQQVLDGFETRKAAILHKAFTGELTAKWREENGVSLESWEKRSLNSVCHSIFDGDHMPPPKSESGVPFLVISNVNTGHLSFNDIRYVPEEYYNNLSETRRPRLGDVLCTIVGTFGIPVIVDSDRKFCFQRHMALLKPRDITTKFLWYLLQWNTMYSKLADIATGTAQLTVPIKGLRAIEFLQPTLQEQMEIVEIIDDILSKSVKIKNVVVQSLKNIDSIKKAILACAFRGELGTNDENDECAVELLKKVL